MEKAIERVSVREKLAPRREPHWRRLETGRSIGYRRMSKSGRAKWLARYYDESSRRYVQKPLGSLDHLPAEEQYDAAKKLCEQWFEHLNLGGSPKSETIAQACQVYADRQRREKTEDAARDCERAFNRLVNHDPLGRISVTKAKVGDFTAWRKRVFDRGSRSYFNRSATFLRAAMNFALARGVASSAHPWKAALRSVEVGESENRRDLYLSREERARLIAACTDELRPLVIAWTMMPTRPGDFSKLRVSHLNLRERTLKIPGPSKHKPGRDVPLSDAALQHFRQCAADKLPSAWLVARADGSKWDRWTWSRQL